MRTSVDEIKKKRGDEPQLFFQIQVRRFLAYPNVPSTDPGGHRKKNKPMLAWGEVRISVGEIKKERGDKPQLFFRFGFLIFWRIRMCPQPTQEATEKKKKVDVGLGGWSGSVLVK
jgi:hypothetical protein